MPAMAGLDQSCSSWCADLLGGGPEAENCGFPQLQVVVYMPFVARQVVLVPQLPFIARRRHPGHGAEADSHGFPCSEDH